MPYNIAAVIPIISPLVLSVRQSKATDPMRRSNGRRGCFTPLPQVAVKSAEPCLGQFSESTTDSPHRDLGQEDSS